VLVYSSFVYGIHGVYLRYLCSITEQYDNRYSVNLIYKIKINVKKKGKQFFFEGHVNSFWNFDREMLVLDPRSIHHSWRAAPLRFATSFDFRLSYFVKYVLRVWTAYIGPGCLFYGQSFKQFPPLQCITLLNLREKLSYLVESTVGTYLIEWFFLTYRIQHSTACNEFPIFYLISSHGWYKYLVVYLSKWVERTSKLTSLNS